MLRQLANGLAAATFLIGPCLAAGPAAADARPSIAIVDFDAAPTGRMLPPPQLGAVAAQLLVDRLVESGQFHVFDGHWLREPGRRMARGADLEQLRANAAAAGVNYVAVGTITRFSQERRSRGFGAGALLRLPFLGALHRDVDELVLAVDVRVVDVRTGEIVTTANGVGSARRSSIGAGGLGLVAAAGGAYTRRASGFQDAQLDESVRESVSAVSRAIVAGATRLKSFIQNVEP